MPKLTKNQIILLSAVAILTLGYFMFFRKPKEVVVIKKTDTTPADKAESSFDTKGKVKCLQCVQAFEQSLMGAPPLIIGDTLVYTSGFVSSRIATLKTCIG